MWYDFLMKRRFLVGLAFLACAIIAALAWILRDTPEKALQDGLRNLLAAKTVKQAVLEVAWTDPATRVTTGFGAAGQIDLKDLTRPRALGVIRASQGFQGPEEQTADIVIEADRFALRPRSVSLDVRKRYESLVKDPQGIAFAILQRDPYLDGNGLSFLVAHGKTEDLRTALASFPSVVRVSGPWTTATEDGRRLATVPFTVQGDAMQPFLSSLVQTWVGDTPTPEEIRWMYRETADLSHGAFSLTIDRSSRLPVRLQGEWPVLDDGGKEILRIRAGLDLDGLNQPVSIAIPASAVDVTDTVMKPRVSNATLPSAPLKPLPEARFATGAAYGIESGAYATGTFSTTTRQFINEKETDLFHIYVEELQRSKPLP